VNQFSERKASKKLNTARKEANKDASTLNIIKVLSES